MRNKQRVLTVVACALFLAIGLVLVRPASPDYRPFVSMSPDPDGVKAVNLLLEESGIHAGSWQRAWRFLPDGPGQALIVIEPDYITWQEREQLLQWTARGNDVHWFARNPATWEIEETAAEDDDGDAGNTLTTVNDVLRSGDQPLTAAVSTSHRIELTDYEPILYDEYGVLAARQTVGDGRFTMWVVPEWLQNDTIQQHDHFQLVWPHLKQAWTAVWFDDYHHGYRTQPGLTAVYPEWMLMIGLQLLLAVALWLLAGAVRFGPAYVPREWIVRRGDETLLATAAWYERSGLTREAFRLQQKFVRSLMHQRWGVRTDASDQQLLAVAKMHWKKHEVEQLAQWLTRWQQFVRAQVYPPKQFVEDSRLADEVIRKLMRK